MGYERANLLQRDHVVAAVAQRFYYFLNPVPSVLAPERVDVGQTPEIQPVQREMLLWHSPDIQGGNAELRQHMDRQQVTRVGLE